MGEASRRKQKQKERLLSEPCCIYCGGPSQETEHMPPVSMFRDRDRPTGMVFACCVDCNRGTRAADLVASWIARLDPKPDAPAWKTEEARARLGEIQELAPGVLEEVFSASQQRDIWPATSGGVRYRTKQIIADGPLLKAHLATFSAKFGMALYREHVGSALPLTGGVETWNSLNAGLARQQAEAMLQILPASATLKQGRKTAGDQFVYRLNTDERTIVAALASFHDGLFVFALSTSDPELYRIPSTFPYRHFTRPGELTARLDASKPAIVIS